MIAALYVETGGVYYGLPDVDPWDEERDARLYAGPWPVIAHPPCNKWAKMGRIAGRGEDGGCFEAALSAVRRYGGVLEHPAESRAWKRYGPPATDSPLDSHPPGRRLGNRDRPARLRVSDPKADLALLCG